MDTKPGDLMGPDAQGKLRISREIPLPWLVGVAAFLCVQALTVWLGQQRMTEDVRELKLTIREINERSQAIVGKDIEHTLKIIEIERRLSNLETKTGKL